MMWLLDIGDAAERLGTTERHMRALIANRKIDYIKVGRLVRFDPSTLDAWIRAQTVTAAP
ncbi:helix-turn-helix domain-containing protein [bacterium]|nr:helix-turn-helix domain-containing protein [bacterium]